MKFNSCLPKYFRCLLPTMISTFYLETSFTSSEQLLQPAVLVSRNFDVELITNISFFLAFRLF